MIGCFFEVVSILPICSESLEEVALLSIEMLKTILLDMPQMIYAVIGGEWWEHMHEAVAVNHFHQIKTIEIQCDSGGGLHQLLLPTCLEQE